MTSYGGWYEKSRAFASDMTTHGNWRGDCPFCKGRNTFSATIDTGTLKWNCYKLGCPVSGVYDYDLTAAEVKANLNRKPIAKDKEVETWEIPAQVVSPQQIHTKHKRFVRRWGLVLGKSMYDIQQERVVFPIYHRGRMIDAIGRAVGKRSQPKWYRYTGKADYFTIGDGDICLVVEDVVSAIVAAQEFPNVTAMAILGTTMNGTHFSKIGEYGKVVIALDPDAVGKTIEYRREIELWTGIKTIGVKLLDDIKYRMLEDMEKLQEVCR
tara:strand:+ start:294 stop:1094 length:801 start_codon:yes stop_codon:yes gene_type:complete